MKFKPITIKDIAQVLGLSTSTVSRALTGDYGISDETRKLVAGCAEKLNYRANPSALSLKERRNYSIGIVIPEIANNFYSQAINGIESIAYNSGYHVIIAQSQESFEREQANIRHLASRSVDGLLVSLSCETTDISYLKELHERGLPMVFFDRVPAEIETHKVISNNYGGAFDATWFLLQSGCKSIAQITCAEHLAITGERMHGYRKALYRAGLPFRQEYVQYCRHGGRDVAEIQLAIEKLLALPNKPDGIFIANDKLSTGTLLALKKQEPYLYGHIQVAGFTNSTVVELFEPPLTAVKQRAYEMGQAATELLVQLIESKWPVTEFQTRVLDTELTLVKVRELV